MYDTLDHVNSKIVQWHYDKDIIENGNDMAQAKKMLEEYCELMSALMPGENPEMVAKRVIGITFELWGNGKIKTVAIEDSEDAIIDAVGDIDVVGVNILERHKVSKLTCLNSVYKIISERGGKRVNGTFVKAGD